MDILIETPTYWKKGDEVLVFDHPIPLNTGGWLKRYLDNVTKHKQFSLVKKLVLFPAPSVLEVENKVKQISQKFSNVDVFSLETLIMLRKVLKEYDFSKWFIRTMHANSYPCVRNLGLIKGALERADLLVLLDDDELILDENFITKASEMDSFHGKTGYYTSEGKQYTHTPSPPKWALKWQKTELITEAVKKSIESKKRFTNTDLALGGCMVITRELYQNICFDPHITRGEDIDFLLNAKRYSYKFMFDSELSVEHVPPQGAKYFWPKFKGDIHRFIYQRQKLKDLGIDLEDLGHYPGDFLKEDLEERIMYTVKNFAKDVLKKEDSNLINFAELEIEKAKKHAEVYSKMYVDYLSEWKKLMKLLDKI